MHIGVVTRGNLARVDDPPGATSPGRKVEHPMHPMAWWHLARAQKGAGCGEGASFGSHGGGPWHGGHHGPSFGNGSGGDDLGGGSFGVRRPLRFLAYKLELDQDQITELAAILAELKTERAQ